MTSSAYSFVTGDTVVDRPNSQPVFPERGGGVRSCQPHQAIVTSNAIHVIRLAAGVVNSAPDGKEYRIGKKRRIT